jgi:hypothetical protein
VGFGRDASGSFRGSGFSNRLDSAGRWFGGCNGKRWRCQLRCSADGLYRGPMFGEYLFKAFDSRGPAFNHLRDSSEAAGGVQMAKEAPKELHVREPGLAILPQVGVLEGIPE